jgi:WD40 repeat protein
VSSSLDGFIHIHDIEDLSYKENKTFNLHQKGVNSFVYSSKHRFIASCGEERHIIMWDPFTLGALSYLYGHNTSVQDLTLNEDRYHLISLGTDKVVKIWDIRTYACIQTIFDKLCYRPEDRLTSIYFDRTTNNILACSRKVNLWFVCTLLNLQYLSLFSSKPKRRLRPLTNFQSLSLSTTTSLKPSSQVTTAASLPFGISKPAN